MYFNGMMLLQLPQTLPLEARCVYTLNSPLNRKFSGIFWSFKLSIFKLVENELIQLVMIQCCDML